MGHTWPVWLLGLFRLVLYRLGFNLIKQRLDFSTKEVTFPLLMSQTITQFLVFVRTSPDCRDTRISSNAKSCLSITNQRPVFRSCDQKWPIIDQYLSHVISMDIDLTMTSVYLSITWIFSWMLSRSQTLMVWREILISIALFVWLTVSYI